MSKNIIPPDKNLYVADTVEENGARFYDVRKAPFEVYGLYEYRTEPEFKRMPDGVAESVSEGVVSLYKNTAGGRVRFCTDSPYIIIRAKMPRKCLFSHMPATGVSGFDLYIDDEESGKSRFFRTFIPPFDMEGGYDSKIAVSGKGLKYFTIHFPLYNCVTDLYIGVADGASVGGGLKYRDIAPVVYYGSSITQGGCASRPGNAYENNISRRLYIDHINLGFSGNCKGEQAMCDYIASLDMSVFVLDYDHNAPNVDFLRKTHYNVYDTVRRAQPTLPIVMISRPDFDGHEDSPLRRSVIVETYNRAVSDGDENVYFIDGETLFNGEDRDNCTVDSTHPNDLGFFRMTDTIAPVIAKILGI